jgi:hypothetical protein
LLPIVAITETPTVMDETTSFCPYGVGLDLVPTGRLDETSFMTSPDDELSSSPRQSTKNKARTTSAPASSRKRNNKNKNNVQYANDHFRDVAESGVWGNVSNTEIFLVGFVAAAIVLVGLGYIVSVVIDFSAATVQHEEAMVRLTAEPPLEPVLLSPKATYEALLDQIKHHSTFQGRVRARVTMNLPKHPQSLPTAVTDPYAAAARWLAYQDPSKAKTHLEILPRFVLATTYFANQGASWHANQGWLSASHVCEWEGISCDHDGRRLVQVDLSRNNLSGTLHAAWGLLEDCLSLLLGDNALTGTMDDLLATSSELAILRLENNQLNGTIPAAFPPQLGPYTTTVLACDHSSSSHTCFRFCVGS